MLHMDKLQGEDIVYPMVRGVDVRWWMHNPQLFELASKATCIKQGVDNFVSVGGPMPDSCTDYTEFSRIANGLNHVAMFNDSSLFLDFRNHLCFESTKGSSAILSKLGDIVSSAMEDLKSILKGTFSELIPDNCLYNA